MEDVFMENLNSKNNKVIGFNNALLFHVSKMILDGRPINGMLTINEYLGADSATRRGLIAMAREKTNEHGLNIPSAMLNKIFEGGAKKSDLTKKELEILKAINEHSYEERKESNIINITPALENRTRVRNNVAKLKDIYLTRRRERRVSFNYAAVACR